MTDPISRRAAELLHLRQRSLGKGAPVSLPITPTSVFNLPGDPAGFAQYGRFDNPTWEATEELLGHLDGAPALAFPSGMAAIAAAIFAAVKSGDRILLPADGYYTTRILSERFLNRLGVSFDLRPTRQFLEKGFEGYSLVFAETPSNPGLDLCDLQQAATLAKEAGAVLVVDNTTMTPFGQNPLDLGADIVVAADTKAPNGHSDALFGHVASRDEPLLQAMRDWRKLSGSIPGPFEAWLVHRGLETLELRFERMCTSAETIAPRLAEHVAVGSVVYPGLAGHPDHDLARRQMRRFGFLIGLTLASAEAADRFIETCTLILPATSFGGVHSSAERRARWGDAVEPGFVRLSIGCEPCEELWAAISAALDEVAT
ncbi:cystathionine gamma-lyase [Chelativorans sp. ZYF759]|uniref:cystathionine gamma-lyase n=1 Tax=Chelativorans sp. ZYF759 TaxID=2692213 RepID=UPI00145EFA27|nr:cystathionine gamma-lyase [Chelativorans sp. ZYF759]NMG41486.1 cystathionine gamma-lyase [Chelativorans sp. ZYF759]